jgi:hypothetical protein
MAAVTGTTYRSWFLVHLHVEPATKAKRSIKLVPLEKPENFLTVTTAMNRGSLFSMAEAQ